MRSSYAGTGRARKRSSIQLAQEHTTLNLDSGNMEPRPMFLQETLPIVRTMIIYPIAILQLPPPEV